MRIAASINNDAAFVVAAGGEAAGRDVDMRCGVFGPIWRLDADAPGATVGMRADDGEVATEIDQSVRKACFAAEQRNAIGGVFLDNSAEVQLHADNRQS